jgi:hypothetical protein
MAVITAMDASPITRRAMGDGRDGRMGEMGEMGAGADGEGPRGSKYAFMSPCRACGASWRCDLLAAIED